MTLRYSVGHWNSFMSAILYLHSKAKYPLQVVLRDIVVMGSFGAELGMELNDNMLMSPENFKYATIIVAVIPILCVYPFLQKHFIKGVLLGGVKG